MVRKRAAAQKALSPEKTVNLKRIRRHSKNDSTNEHFSDNENNEEEKGGNETEDLENGCNDGTIDDDKYSTHSENDEYDELPDFNIFSKELSDKAKTFWGAVISDYTDFANWTSLLQTVTDEEDNLEASRTVYNCFLRYFPYCYGYWKKFADIEKKNGYFENAKKIFQRGVEAIPISIDLWVHYLNFTIQQCKGKEKSNHIIRGLFDQAIDAAGMEFKSNKLWDAYIEWEKSVGNLKHVTEIYDKLIATPTSNYMKNWEKFKRHLEKHSLLDILPTEEYSRVMQKMDFIPPGMANEDEPTIITTKAPGEGAVEEMEDYEPEEVNDKKLDQEKSDTLKRKIIAERESIFVETAGEIKKRWAYEDSIKRPYFHVKPLEKTQLNNWKEYLDYEIREGSHKRICFLFERCLVACALYENFWRKFIDYIEPIDKQKTHEVYERACTVHLIKNYKINLDWSTFEERENNYDLASKILLNIDRNFPGMIIIAQRRVGLARRMNRLDDVISIYEQTIVKSERIEDKIFYYIKLSTFLAKFCNDKRRARNTLWKALELGKKHKRLYLQLLDLEMHYGKIDIEHVDRLFTAVENDMSLNDDFQDIFSLRKLEFYEDYCDDVEKILRVKEKYTIDNKKREAAKRYFSNSDMHENQPSKVQKMESDNISNISAISTPTDNSHYTQEQHQQWYQQQMGSSDNADYYNPEYWANYATQYAYQQQQQQQQQSSKQKQQK